MWNERTTSNEQPCLLTHAQADPRKNIKFGDTATWYIMCNNRCLFSYISIQRRCTGRGSYLGRILLESGSEPPSLPSCGRFIMILLCVLLYRRCYPCVWVVSVPLCRSPFGFLVDAGVFRVCALTSLRDNGARVRSISTQNRIT